MINIKEIANIAGVSIATVSKIVNNKSDDISQETIDRVLKIVKQYNYTPYGNTRNSTLTKSLTIGLLIKQLRNANLMINGLVKSLNEHGYSLVLFDSESSPEKERMNISKINSQNLDGIICEPMDDSSSEFINQFDDKSMKKIFITENAAFPNFYFIDYTKMGFIATQSLVNKHHTKIACVIKGTSQRSESVLKGYKQCLFENNIIFNPDNVIDIENLTNISELSKEITGIVSSHFAITQKLLERLALSHVSTPADLSLVSLQDDVREYMDIANVSAVTIPNYDFGRFLGNCIVSLCEKKNESLPISFSYRYELTSSITIDIPFNMRSPKIVVVGSINVDNILYLNKLPTPGETQIASECILMAGGKGLNQAIGVSMLKKEVTLIGKIGKDTEGIFVCQSLSLHGVDTSSIISDSAVRTGKAFISINPDGESTITVAKGANNEFTVHDIKERMQLFENAGYCLIQGEIPMDTIHEAAKIAKFYGACTIFKPATVSHMKDEDFKNIDIFIPNRREAKNLSNVENVDEQAAYFLSKGVKVVIITLGSSGSYLRTKEVSRYFDAPTIDVIDTTGASDAFISSLAVQLLDGKDYSDAIRIATISAGFCVSKFGVSNSLIDRDTLNRYIIQHHLDY